METLASVDISSIRRGVSPEILLTHIRNTAPYLLGDEPYSLAKARCFKILQDIEKSEDKSQDHARYYEMCVSAHFATVATFVPTDVDNQIRFKLWHPTLDAKTIEEMVLTVEESLHWDVLPVTTRFVVSPERGDIISGHHGEWFSIAAGAYGATRKRDPRRAKDILQKIICEIEREGRILSELADAQDGKGVLCASMLIAHNLGDLNRVIEMWGIVDEDPLFIAAARTSDKNYLSNVFHISAELNRLYMANENHRHFTLRAPKALRKSPKLLLPLGPYFDDWGRTLVRSEELTDVELGIVAEALIDGWVKMPETFGYARAIAGIEDALGGPRELGKLLPSRLAKQMQTGKMRTIISQPQAKFEGQWNNIALKWLRANRVFH